MSEEIGDKRGTASCFGVLGSAYLSRGEYAKAKESYNKSLSILRDTHLREGELKAFLCESQGMVHQHLCEYGNARQYYEKALEIRKQRGDRKGEGSCYDKLGTLSTLLGQYGVAKEYFENAIRISIDVGYKSLQASAYGNLANVFQTHGDFIGALEYHLKALEIRLLLGDKVGVASHYSNIGIVHLSLGDFDKCEENLNRAIAICKESGCRNTEAHVYGHLATVFNLRGKQMEAKQYYEKALVIFKEIGDRLGEACCYMTFGGMLTRSGEYSAAKRCIEHALYIVEEIGMRKFEAFNRSLLANVIHLLGDARMAENHFKRALKLCQEIGAARIELECLCQFALFNLIEGQTQDAFHYLLSSIKKCETLRGYLRENDEYKVSFSDTKRFPYWLLCELLFVSGKSEEALYASELGRARALADLMATQYSLKNQISVDPRTWFGIEKIMNRESMCTCLHISYSSQLVLLWVINTNGVVRSRRVELDDKILPRQSNGALETDIFAKSFRRFGVLPEDVFCEDRSFSEIRGKVESLEGDELKPSRLLEGDETEQTELSPSMYYNLIITPVIQWLEEPEVIIVPDRSLHHVPFAALPDERGKYFGETFRIRIVPSLTTLKLIQDSPVDYHCQTGALIVGDPTVVDVLYKGYAVNFSSLPFARKEAEMIGRLLGVQPLLAERATKQAVLQKINSVSLIHFAAHGDAERGEIALAPSCTSKRSPQEDDFLLTMSDISKVQLRAKLVVLSCCHSAKGQIKTEGVVGIARAFLGSGARSVLVALWAIDDEATEQLMSRFYGHLVLGRSASESLHEAMRWMRNNGFKISQWAPFLLIGDNVTFDFGK